MQHQEKQPHTELKAIITKETYDKLKAVAKQQNTSEDVLVELALKLYLEQVRRG